MRRIWTTTLITALALAIALPATAKKPSKPPTSVPVAASLDGNPMWVHEIGDVIVYDLTVQNKTRSPVSVYIEHHDSNPVILAPRAIAEFPDLFRYAVTQEDVAAGDDIASTATVSYSDGYVTAETSNVMDPVDECDFAELVGGEVCIWQPGASGGWTISVMPDPVPNRPTRTMLTMRDHVPGNWCTFADGSGGIEQDRWLPGRDAPVVLEVYLPENGFCLSGGAGGAFFAIGNPNSFYLYSTFDGKAVVTHS